MPWYLAVAYNIHAQVSKSRPKEKQKKKAASLSHLNLPRRIYLPYSILIQNPLLIFTPPSLPFLLPSTYKNPHPHLLLSLPAPALQAYTPDTLAPLAAEAGNFLLAPQAAHGSVAVEAVPHTHTPAVVVVVVVAAAADPHTSPAAHHQLLEEGEEHTQSALDPDIRSQTAAAQKAASRTNASDRPDYRNAPSPIPAARNFVVDLLLQHWGALYLAAMVRTDRQKGVRAWEFVAE